MYRTTTIILTLATLALAILTGGCAATQAPKTSELSLMERFHSGKALIGESDETADAQAQQHLTRGVTFAAQGRQELAFEQFSRAARLDPALTEARQRRGEILLAKGLYDQALADFMDVLDKLPDYAPAHEAAGMVYFRSNLYPEAEEHLTRAVALDPRSVRALLHLGAIHNYWGHYDKAVATFQAALLVEPGNGTIYNNMGLTYSVMGNDEGAVDAFRTALRLGAPSAKAYNNMGLALARLGRNAEALEAFRCAEGEAAAYNNLGYVYFLDGRYAQAVASFQRAIDLEPSYYHRAHENLKRSRLALRFEQSASGGPSLAALRTDIPELGGTGVVAALPIGPLRQVVDTGSGPALVETDPVPAAPAMRLGRTIPRIPVSAHSVPQAPTLAVSNSVTTAAQAGLPVLTQTAHSSTTVPRAFKADPLEDRPLYTLHFSSWRTRFNALREAARLRDKGNFTTIIPITLPDSGDWWRVTIGSFNTLQEAREAMSELKKDTGYESVRIVRRSHLERDAIKDL